MNSQGTAVIAGAIPSLSPALKNKIKGVILFGYSLNKQKNGGIPDFPKDKVEVYCHTGDLVCDGQLQPTPEHLNYIDEAKNDAPKFLIGKLGRLEGN
jgi:cutinase